MRHRSIVVWITLSALLTAQFVVAPAVRAVTPAAGGAVNVPSGFAIVPPWATGTHTITQAYGMNYHANTSSPTNTNDYYALDFNFALDEGVYPVAGGTVIFAGPASGGWATYGNLVYIDHGNGFKSIYAHLNTLAVSVGQSVGTGTRLGGAGNSGGWTDVHLHFALYFQSLAQPQPYGGYAAVPEPFTSCTKNGNGTCENLAAGNVLTRSGGGGGGGTDSTAPSVGWDGPADGATITSGTVGLQAHATDSGGSHLSTISFSAKYGGAWHGVATNGVAGDSASTSLTWDLCTAGVPDGDVELGLEATDGAGNKDVWSNHGANRHFTKNYNCSPPASPPAAPTNVSATATSSTSILLSWTDASSNEDGFRVKTWTGLVWALTATLPAGTQSYPDTGLTPGTGYTLSVCAYTNSGQEACGPYATATTSAADLTPPAGYWTSPADRSTVLSRSMALQASATDSGGSGLKSVRFSAMYSGSWHVIANVGVAGSSALPGSPWDLCAAGVPDGDVELGLEVFDAAGNSFTYSNSRPNLHITKRFACSPPAAPTNVSATATSSTSILLSWTDASSNEDGFRVKTWTGLVWALTATLPAGTQSYPDTGLTPGTGYTLSVCAYTNSGQEACGGYVTATTVAADTVPPVATWTNPADRSTIQSRAVLLQANATDSGGSGLKAVRFSAMYSGSWHALTSVSVAGSSAPASFTWDMCTAGVPDGDVELGLEAADGAGNQFTYSNRWTNFHITKQFACSPPTAPTGISATTLSSTSIRFVWADNSSNESGFRVKRWSVPDGQVWVDVASVGAGATSYTDTGLQPNTGYWYTACAYNSGGEACAASTTWVSAVTFPLPPTAPSNVSATALSSTSIRFQWSDNSSNETGFRVKRWSVPDGQVWIDVATVGAGVTTFTDTGLQANVGYWYYACAYNSGGEMCPAGWLGATTLPPPLIAPSGLIATPLSSTSIQFTWVDNSSGEDGFRVKTWTGSAWVLTATVAANTQQYLDIGLAPNSPYTLSVCAFTNAGAEACASNVSAVTPPDAPSAPQNNGATPLSSTSIEYTWSDNSANEDGFRIWRWSVPDGQQWVEAGTAPAGATAFTDTDLQPSTGYWYYACAYNSGGEACAPSWVGAVTLVAPPAPPASVGAVAVSDTSVLYTWADNSSNEDGFRIWRWSMPDGQQWVLAANAGADTITFTDTGLQPSTGYWYYVCAYNSGGETCADGWLGAVTTLGDTTAPVFSEAAAVALRALAPLASASTSAPVPVTVSWLAADEALGSGLDHYTLERQLNGGAWAAVPLPQPTATSLATTAPSTGSVAYRVTACDVAGNCAQSSTGSRTLRITQNASTLVNWSSSWTLYRASANSGGSLRYSKSKNAYATFTFTGRAIGFVGMKGAGRGTVKVYVDGKLKATVSLYKTGATQYRLLAWQHAFPTSAKHTIKLVVAGTAGRPRVDLDAFVVLK
jgi:titin